MTLSANLNSMWNQFCHKATGWTQSTAKHYGKGLLWQNTTPIINFGAVVIGSQLCLPPCVSQWVIGPVIAPVVAQTVLPKMIRAADTTVRYAQHKFNERRYLAGVNAAAKEIEQAKSITDDTYVLV